MPNEWCHQYYAGNNTVSNNIQSARNIRSGSPVNLMKQSGQIEKRAIDDFPNRSVRYTNVYILVVALIIILRDVQSLKFGSFWI